MGALVDLVRQHLAFVICGTTTLVAIAGSIINGLSFVTDPIPFPALAAGVWMTINGILAAVAIFAIYRNVTRYRDILTWQEFSFARGVFIVIFAGLMGYMARAFEDPSITLGTPVFTIGILYLIWASLNRPVRFTREGNYGRSRGSD